VTGMEIRSLMLMLTGRILNWVRRMGVTGGMIKQGSLMGTASRFGILTSQIMDALVPSRILINTAISRTPLEELPVEDLHNQSMAVKGVL